MGSTGLKFISVQATFQVHIGKFARVVFILKLGRTGPHALARLYYRVREDRWPVLNGKL